MVTKLVRLYPLVVSPSSYYIQPPTLLDAKLCFYLIIGKPEESPNGSYAGFKLCSRHIVCLGFMLTNVIQIKSVNEIVES